jgi:hypothetical protein
MKWLVALILVVSFGLATNANIVPRPEEKRLPRPKIEPKKEPVIADNCEVIIDGKKAKIEDLKEGMEAVFTVENGYIIRIVVTTRKTK